MTEHEIVGAFVDQRETRVGEDSGQERRRVLGDLGGLARAGWCDLVRLRG